MTTTLATSDSKLQPTLNHLATDVVHRAMKGGATAAECVVREGDEFSTVVRLGQVETLKESGSRAIGVRVFFGQRAASTYSSDFSAAGIERMLKSALELAKICSEDPYAGIPEAASSDRLRATSIFITRTFTPCPAPSASTTHAAPKRPRSTPIRASRTPKADRSTPPPAEKCWRILTALSASTGGRTVRLRLCPSRKTTNGGMQRDYWYSVARSLAKLDSAEQVGQRSGAPHAAASGRAQGEDRACAGRARSHGRQLHARTYFRGREWRLGLSRSLVPGGQTRRENCRSERHRHRRRHHARRFRHRALRWRRHSHAPHGGD